ncbi:hypothetical protein Tco_0460865 [Tanacetum coccineum]
MPPNRRTRALGLSLLVRPPEPIPTMMTTSVGNNSVFRSFFEKQKLTGPNFIDWYRQLRLVLSTEDKEYYLEHPIPVCTSCTTWRANFLLRTLQLMLHGLKGKGKLQQCS